MPCSSKISNMQLSALWFPLFITTKAVRAVKKEKNSYPNCFYQLDVRSKVEPRAETRGRKLSKLSRCWIVSTVLGIVKIGERINSWPIAYEADGFYYKFVFADTPIHDQFDYSLVHKGDAAFE